MFINNIIVLLQFQLIMENYFCSLLKILKNLLSCHPVLRQILALQEDFYLDLLDGTIMFMKNEEIRYECSCVLTYLLFCDLFKSGDSLEDKRKLLLCRSIYQRYLYIVSKYSVVEFEC